MSKLFTSVALILALGGCAVVQPPHEADVVESQALPTIEEQVIAEHEIYTPELRSGTAEQFAEALAQLQSGEHAKAQKLFERLTKRQPELAGPWLNLGRLQLEAGDEEAAKASFMRALEANPQSCYAHTQLGVLLRRSGEFQAARSHYVSCLAAYPDFSLAHLNLGILSELYLGDLETALVAYERYLELTPDAPPRVKGWVMDLRRRIGA